MGGEGEVDSRALICTGYFGGDRVASTLMDPPLEGKKNQRNSSTENKINELEGNIVK